MLPTKVKIGVAAELGNSEHQNSFELKLKDIDHILIDGELSSSNHLSILLPCKSAKYTNIKVKINMDLV